MLDTELKRIVEEQTQCFSHKELLDAARIISEKYRNNVGSSVKFAVSSAEIAAYALVRMPATFAAVSSAFSFSADYFTDEISSALDVGAGTGAASWAAAQVFPSLSHILCLERENNMRIFGEKLMQEAGFPHRYEWRSFDISKDELSEKADLVCASYMLGELRDSDIADTVRKLWKSTNKLLVIIEPGTVRGYDTVRKAREYLIDAGGFVCAPCPHCSNCSLGNDDWCHFSVRISRSKLHKLLKGGDSPFEDEKFSYIAVSKQDFGRCSCRVLRHPQTDPGRIGLMLCTKDGISQKTVTKKDAAFKSARKLRCGDVFE